MSSVILFDIRLLSQALFLRVHHIFQMYLSHSSVLRDESLWTPMTRTNAVTTRQSVAVHPLYRMPVTNDTGFGAADSQRYA